MKNQSKCLFISSWSQLLLVLIFLHGTSVIAQEVEDEREFDYGEGSKKGPGRWGELKKEWEACNHGGMQSPIDMSNQRVHIIRTSKELKRDYIPCNATVRNRGHDITIQWIGDSAAGSVKINSNVYFLRQAHWHSPSEHSINGRRYDMELHMVHECPDPSVKNKIAVIGVLYKIGKPDSFLSKLTEDITYLRDRMEERNLGVMDPTEIKMGGRNYYRYMGSLTVPPCTEGVIWTLSTKVRTVSKDQVDLLREAVHDYAARNARPLQPLNGRDVHLHAPRFTRA